MLPIAFLLGNQYLGLELGEFDHPMILTHYSLRGNTEDKFQVFRDVTFFFFLKENVDKKVKGQKWELWQINILKMISRTEKSECVFL